MKLVESKEDREKVLRETPELANFGLLVKLPLIPVGLFLITTVVWLIKSADSYLDALPTLLRLTLTLCVIFVALGIFSLRRIYTLIPEALKHPFYLVMGFTVNAYILFSYIKPFTDVEVAQYKKYWFVYVLAWLLFPIIENKRVKEFIAQRKLKKAIWILRLPVWIIVFYTALIVLIVDGVALFGRIFDFLMCSGSGQCFS